MARRAPNYLLGHTTTKLTPQIAPIFGRESEMAKNNAGGYTFTLDKWEMLNRFLILGAEGGTYYASEQTLVLQNAKNLQDCIKEDGLRVVATLVQFADENRAPRYNTLLFALALCAKTGTVATREAANRAVSKLCRIGTHLFTYMSFVKNFGGLGSGTRRSLQRWYNSMHPDKLAYQLAKYQSRDGWSHRDILRLAHPKPLDTPHHLLYGYATGKEEVVKAFSDLLVDAPNRTKFELFLWAVERAKKVTDEKEIISLIDQYDLPRECIPTRWLNSASVWGALLQHMPITATLRNLGKLSSMGLLTPLSDSTKIVSERLTNADIVTRGRVHPIAVLTALHVYGQGRGIKGSNFWTVNQQVMDAVNDCFYLAFATVEPTGKRHYLGLDVSGSMAGASIAGLNGITARMAVAAMSMVTARSERNYHVAGFCGGYGRGASTKMVNLPISPRQRLDEVMKIVDRSDFGSTDCSLPMLDALEKNIPVDTFVIYTDNETYAGSIQPSQALVKYRQKTGIAAKLVVVGTTATRFTIADPRDISMLDVVGFDTSAPGIIADFSAGRF